MLGVSFIFLIFLPPIHFFLSLSNRFDRLLAVLATEAVIVKELRSNYLLCFSKIIFTQVVSFLRMPFLFHNCMLIVNTANIL